MTDTGSDDVAVIVYREEDDAWEADVLPVALTEDLAGLIQALRQQPSIGGTFGLVAVGDDFFVVLRAIGGQVTVFLSDLTAALDWPLARQVLGHLEIELPGPAGAAGGGRRRGPPPGPGGRRAGGGPGGGLRPGRPGPAGGGAGAKR